MILIRIMRGEGRRGGVLRVCRIMEHGWSAWLDMRRFGRGCGAGGGSMEEQLLSLLCFGDGDGKLV